MRIECEVMASHQVYQTHKYIQFFVTLKFQFDFFNHCELRIWLHWRCETCTSSKRRKKKQLWVSHEWHKHTLSHHRQMCIFVLCYVCFSFPIQLIRRLLWFKSYRRLRQENRLLLWICYCDRPNVRECVPVFVIFSFSLSHSPWKIEMNWAQFIHNLKSYHWYDMCPCAICSSILQITDNLWSLTIQSQHLTILNVSFKWQLFYLNLC